MTNEHRWKNSEGEPMTTIFTVVGGACFGTTFPDGPTPEEHGRRYMEALRDLERRSR